ncbi:MAG: hypothetical protein V4614_11960 [Pseudomonadota bacterium]
MNSLVNAHLSAAALLALGFSLCAPAQAARPLNTDDARIVDANSCQLESWVRRNETSTEYWALPGCNFTGNLELTLGGARTNDATGNPIGRTVLQGKTILKPLEKNGWGLGFAAGTVRRAQGNTSSSDVYAYVPASLSFADDRWVVHTNVGWSREQATRRDLATWGVGLERELTASTWLIAETFGQSRERPQFQMGLRQWIVPGQVQIDATYGNRAGGGASERWFSIGLRLLSVPFLK